MEAFYTLMILTGVVIARYFLVRYQSTRALRLAGDKTVELIRKCESWLITINGMIGVDDDMKHRMKRDILRTVTKAGSDEEFYWKAYFEDFDYNGLWLNPTKWTMGQMYPKLVELAKIEDITVSDGV